MNESNQQPFVDKQAQFDSLVEQITSDVEHLQKYNQFLDECIENMGTEKDNKRMRTQMNAQIGDANELIQSLMRQFQELEEIKFKSRKDNENKNKVLRRLNNSFEEYYEKFTNQIKDIANSEKKFIDVKQSIFNASSIQEPNRTVHYEQGGTIQPEHYSQTGSHYQQEGNGEEQHYDQNQQYDEQYQHDPNYQSYHQHNNQSQGGYYDEAGNYIGEQQGQEGQYNNYEHQQEGGYYDNNNQQYYGENQEGGYYENQQHYGEHQEGGHYQNEQYGEHQGEQYNQQYQENQEGGYQEGTHQESVHENTEGGTGEHRGNSQYGSVAQQGSFHKGSQMQKSVHGGSVVHRGGSNFGSIRGSVVQKPYENKEELRQSIAEATTNLEFYASIIKQRESQLGDLKKISSVIGGGEGLKQQSFGEESKEVERSEDVEVPVNEESNFDNGIKAPENKKKKAAKKYPKLNMLLILLIAVFCIGLAVTFFAIQ